MQAEKRDLHAISREREFTGPDTVLAICFPEAIPPAVTRPDRQGALDLPSGAVVHGKCIPPL